MGFPSIGAVVADKYRLDDVVGEGGFAVVFSATDLTVGRVVALKVLKPDESGYTSETAARFKREARVLAGLSGPHTVRLFDFGRTPDGLMYMAFEMLGGVDLRGYLDAEGTLGEEDTLIIARQILESLREAHGAGILHRDIKPANVRVFQAADDRLRVKLLDFGIARPIGPAAIAITQAGRAVGTPRYMSPEQSMGVDLDPTSDLFSVGLVIVEMLCGDPREPLNGFFAGRPLELPASPRLVRVLERLLQRNAERRYQSAEDVLRDLSAGQQTERPVAPSPPAPSPTAHIDGEPAPIPSLAWGRVLVVGAAVAVLGGGIVWLLQTESTAPAQSNIAIQRVLNTPLVREPVASNDSHQPKRDDADVGPSAVDGCGRSAEPGSTTKRAVVGISTMSWVVRIPRNYDPDAKHPLLLVFYGTGGSVPDIVGNAGIGSAADELGAIVASPSGDGIWSFAGETDAERYRIVVDQTAKEYCVDHERVFAIGHDAGGLAAEMLTCAPWVAAVATTSYRPREFPLPCPERPAPRIMFAPTQSRHLPVTSGDQCLGAVTQPLVAYEEVWRARNHCAPEPAPYDVGAGAKCQTWACDRPLVSCLVDGGQNWRGMVPRQWDVLKCDGPSPDFDYFRNIWAFFDSVASAEQHPVE